MASKVLTTAEWRIVCQSTEIPAQLRQILINLRDKLSLSKAPTEPYKAS